MINRTAISILIVFAKNRTKLTISKAGKKANYLFLQLGNNKLHILKILPFDKCEEYIRNIFRCSRELWNYTTLLQQPFNGNISKIQILP